MQPVAREGEPSQQSKLTLQQSDLADASCSDQQFLVFTQDANPELTYKEFLMIPPGKEYPVTSTQCTKIGGEAVRTLATTKISQQSQQGGNETRQKATHQHSQGSSKDKMTEILKTVKETNILLKTFNEENIKLREENKKIVLHFTKEFLMLKREMAEVLETVKHRDNFDKLPQFPLTSHSAVMDFEMRLRSDKEMQSQLMNKFSKTNNDDGVNKFIKENLKSLFYHDGVTRKFAWTDAKENIAVKDFTIIQNLRDACLINVASSKLNKINEVIKNYFVGAKDRFRKASQRKNAKEIFTSRETTTTSEMGAGTGNIEENYNDATESSDLFD